MSWIARPLCMLYGGHSYGRYEDVFTCRKCLLESAAQANLVLAHKRLALETT